MQHKAYLLLGSNIEPRLIYIEKAVALLGKNISVRKKSSIYETAAWGMKEGTPPFLNMVAGIATDMDATGLLRFCIQCETELGRMRTNEVSSRTIDIDILLYDDVIINSGDLILPHPRMHLRRFTLMPLAEIASAVIHPVFHKSIGELLRESEDDSEVKVYASAP